MPKVFSIFIQIILMFKILFSSQLTKIEMKDFKSTNTQKIQSNNIFFPTHFGNTKIIKIQSKFKLDNRLLIFLSNDKFKYCILPYLSSHNFLKFFFYFQNLVPELNFQKFLPPLRFYTTNNVLDIQEPTRYLQPLEINFLYQFHGEYLSLKPHILYSFKNEIPIIVDPHVPISPDSICAHLSQNKIISYENYVIPTSSHQKLLILKDNGGDQFFVTFQKSEGQFVNIARGSRILEINFSDYVECIWEAYNLKGWKYYYWKIKSFLTLPHVKYLLYFDKIISYLYPHFFHCFQIFSNYLEKAIKVHNLCGCLFFFLIWLPYFLMIYSATYILLFLYYYTFMLPFFVLSFPLKHFFFGFNWYSFLFVSPALASLYICVFPHVKQCVPFSGKIMNTEFHISQDVVKSFEIKPTKIMSLVPLLVQNRNKCWVECLDTFMLSLVIFGLGAPMSLILIFGGGPYF